MEDIAPELLLRVRESFLDNIKQNKRAAKLLETIAQGGTYADAGEYAYEIGAALADAFTANFSAATLPDGRLYENIARRVVSPMLQEDYSLVSVVATQVQDTLNRQAGVGLKAQSAALDAERVEGIVRKVSNAENYDDIAWVLVEPVKTFSQAVVDETLKRNAEFQSEAGLRPRIIRKAESKCCKWCSGLEGSYRYPNDVPHDLYRRHNRCRCTVDYDPGSGLRQNVWSKKRTTPEERAKIEARKALEPDRFATAIQARINRGEYKLEQSHQKYLKHVDGTPQFEQYRKSRVEKGETAQSRLTISEEYAQKLIDKYAGKGTPYITDSASVANKEFATDDKVIGQYCTIGGQWIDTKRFEIHYGKNDCHIVPVKEKK